MKTLNATLIADKNALRAEIPWAMLFHIEVDDEAANDLYLAAHQVDVTWNSQTWTATEFDIDPITEHGSGRLADLNVTIQNVDRQASAYLERGTIIGRDITIYFVPVEEGVTTDVISYTYRVNRANTTAKAATFELGHENLFALDIPWQRHIRDKCRFEYKSSGQCDYPNDDFEEGSAQDLRVGGDGVKFGGWNVLNTANADSVEIDGTTYPGDLYIDLKSGAAYDWDDTTTAGPYVYKELTGDWDFYSEFDLYFAIADFYTALIVQSTSDLTDWIAFMSLTAGDAQIRNTVNGASSETTGLTHNSFQWRLARAGNTFTWYSRNAVGDSWTTIGSITRTDMAQRLRIGFAVFSSASAGYGVAWKFFTVTSGGLGTCDYTFDGDNGCRIHQNTRNFGGAPGIPYGRLYF